MCIAQDRRLKSIHKAASLPPSVKSGRFHHPLDDKNVHSIFKHRHLLAHAIASKVTLSKQASACPISTTNVGCSQSSCETPKPQDHKPQDHKTQVKLAPRPSPLKVSREKSNESLEEMLTIHRSKSFDESRQDEYSTLWTGPSTTTASQAMSHQSSSNSKVDLDLDFLKDVPSGGIVNLPRGYITNSFSFSSFPSDTDLTSHMANLKMKPEPLQVENADSLTPTVTIPEYPNIKTPPTPRHDYKACCHFDHFPVPPHLFLPTFLE